MKVYQEIAALVEARANCLKRVVVMAAPDGPTAIDTGVGYVSQKSWVERHEETIASLVRERLPSGSGFDNGTTIDYDRSTGDRLVFLTSFHHMTEHGYYDGWTEYSVIVRPTFAGFRLTVTGRDRNAIKEDIAETFHDALSREVKLVSNFDGGVSIVSVASAIGDSP